MNFSRIRFDGVAQNVFAGAAANREHAVRRDLRDGLLELVVHLVLGLLGFLARHNCRADDSFEHQLVAKLFAKFGILRNALRENVQGPSIASSTVSMRLFSAGSGGVGRRTQAGLRLRLLRASAAGAGGLLRRLPTADH